MFPTFWDKGTEVPSLSWDKGTTGQPQNFAPGRDSPGPGPALCPGFLKQILYLKVTQIN